MATVRRVRRIIRKIDPWTALKVSAVVWAVVAVGVVLGIVIFWSVLERAGIPDRLTEFMIEITLMEEGSRPFANTERFLRFAILGSVVWWAFMTGASTGFAIVYNLVSDVVGGVEVVVLEESLNPVAASAPQVLHAPADYRAGAVMPDDGHADIPTEESPAAPVAEGEPARVE